MSDVPVQLIVATFKDENGAHEAIKALKQAKREKVIGIENAAELRKDKKGKLHIKEVHDMGGGKGSVIGGVIGGAIGVIAGPALVVPAAVGALIGGLSAKLRDGGFKDDRLKLVGEGLQPGTSAIVAVVEHKWVDTLRQELANEAADVLAADIGADIAAQLEAGHDVAYTALASQEGLMVGRVAGNEEEEEGGMMVVDDSGVYGARYVATQKGFAVERMAETDEGAVIEVAGATENEAAYGIVATDGETVVAGAAMAKVEDDTPEEDDEKAKSS